MMPTTPETTPREGRLRGAGNVAEVALSVRILGLGRRPHSSGKFSRKRPPP